MPHVRPARLWLVVAVVLLAARTSATPKMQTDAKTLRFPVGNCQYCHASFHATEVMKQRARSIGVSEGNCAVCHGSNIPAKLNERGRWLVAEKARRGAKDFDMAWLREYTETAPASPKPKGSPPKP